jgi:hypothetical protein
MNVALAADVSHGDTRHPVTFRPPGAQSVALALTLHPFAVRPAKKLRKFSAPNQYEKKSKRDCEWWRTFSSQLGGTGSARQMTVSLQRAVPIRGLALVAASL